MDIIYESISFSKNRILGKIPPLHLLQQFCCEDCEDIESPNRQRCNICGRGNLYNIGIIAHASSCKYAHLYMNYKKYMLTTNSKI